MELRKAIITKTTVENKSPNPRSHPELNKTLVEEHSVLFHKWFDGLSQRGNEPIQYAILEFEDGSVKQVDINIWKIIFQTKV